MLNILAVSFSNPSLGFYLILAGIFLVGIIAFLLIPDEEGDVLAFSVIMIVISVFFLVGYWLMRLYFAVLGDIGGWILTPITFIFLFGLGMFLVSASVGP